MQYWIKQHDKWSGISRPRRSWPGPTSRKRGASEQRWEGWAGGRGRRTDNTLVDGVVVKLPQNDRAKYWRGEWALGRRENVAIPSCPLVLKSKCHVGSVNGPGQGGRNEFRQNLLRHWKWELDGKNNRDVVGEGEKSQELLFYHCLWDNHNWKKVLLVSLDSLWTSPIFY